MTSAQTQHNLLETWRMLFPAIEPPPPAQFNVWEIQHSEEIIKHGLAQSACKNLRLGGTMNQDYAVRFASSVMNRLSKS